MDIWPLFRQETYIMGDGDFAALQDAYGTFGLALDWSEEEDRYEVREVYSNKLVFFTSNFKTDEDQMDSVYAWLEGMQYVRSKQRG